jgi:hypothetical protein
MILERGRTACDPAYATIKMDLDGGIHKNRQSDFHCDQTSILLQVTEKEYDVFCW